MTGLVWLVQQLVLVGVLVSLVCLQNTRRDTAAPARQAQQGLNRPDDAPVLAISVADASTGTGSSRLSSPPLVSLQQTYVAPPPRNEVSSTATSVKDFQPGEIALLQFDSRPLGDYWQSSALWNKNYCNRHGHSYIYYSLKTRGGCVHPSGEKLADPWCKVLAMLRANADYPQVKLFIYLDSDAVIDERFADTDLVALMGVMQSKLGWDLQQRPVVFNQDGPCWWCKLVESKGYPICLNAGTVVWHRHAHSTKVLEAWWAAAMDEQLEGNPLKRRFRLKWPWEQDRQMAVYNRTPEHIQIASQPGRAFMDIRAGHHDWCLSHLQQSNCFISHHCENERSKKKMREKYDKHTSTSGLTAADIKVDFL